MGRRLAVAIVGVLLAVAAGYILYTQLFGEETTRASSESPQADAAPTVKVDAGAVESSTIPTVTAVEGTVERQVADDQWEVVTEGMTLRSDDVIRTKDDGRITLDVNGNTVVVDRNTQLDLPQLADVDVVRVGEGRVSATVPGGGRPLRVQVEGSDAVAETGKGEFDVLASGGDATVATRTGSVKLRAGGEEVEVPAGKLSTVSGNATPSAPRAIPASLFVKVQRASKTRRRRYTVRGETTPGAVISVNGVKVRVGEDGKFAKVIALREGSNSVKVEGRDALGRSKREVRRIELDSKPPSVGGDVKWGN